MANLNRNQYGEYVAGVIHPPTHSPISNQPVRSGFVQIPLSKTHFVRVNASEWAGLPRQVKADFKTEWKAQMQDISPSVEEEVQDKMPDFDVMTFDALKAFAAEQGYDVTGRRSTDALRAAVRTAYLTAQFPPSLAPAADSDELSSDEEV